MDALAVDDDGIVFWQTASYLGGYYSTWPITATNRSDLDNQLEIHLDRPAALTLPWGPPEALKIGRIRIPAIGQIVVPSRQ